MTTKAQGEKKRRVGLVTIQIHPAALEWARRLIPKVSRMTILTQGNPAACRTDVLRFAIFAGLRQLELATEDDVVERVFGKSV